VPHSEALRPPPRRGGLEALSGAKSKGSFFKDLSKRVDPDEEFKGSKGRGFE